MKLSDILKEFDLNDDAISKATVYFNNLKKDQFVYPNRLGDKLGISNTKAAALIHRLVLENILVHVSVPMDPDTREVFEENYVRAILAKFKSDFIVHDEDMNEISSKNLVPVAAFLRA